MNIFPPFPPVFDFGQQTADPPRIWTRTSPAPYLCNSGGPRSRTRSESISLTLLGDRKRFGHWECTEIVFLRFPDRVSPRQWCLDALVRLGYSHPEDLLPLVQIPGKPLHARAVKKPGPIDGDTPNPLAQASLQDLRAALILGKCTDELFDPAPPAIWSNRRLTRAIELYEPGDFYAD